MNRSIAIALAGVAGLSLLAGCRHSPNAPTKTGFLYTYNNLVQVDASTWRYINADRLPIYRRFTIDPVKVMVKEWEGKELTAEQRAKAAAYVRKALTEALQDKYPIVTEPGVDVGEFRIAITSAYKKGMQVGFSLEGEVLDSYTAVQVAAVTRSEVGELYIGSWWDGPSFKQMVDAWAKRVREALDKVDNK